MVQPLQLSQVPIIDLSRLRQHHDTNSPPIIKDIHEACRKMGFFYVINHGIPESVIEGAFEVNSEFFKLPMVMKEELISDDVHKPVRFSPIRAEGQGNAQSLRDFLKVYAYPVEEFIALWPRYPPNYKEKMELYSTEVRKVSIEIFGALMESLNLGSTYMKEEFKGGVQIMGMNSYPPFSGSNINTSILSHTDHSIITILLQSCPGLDIVDKIDGDQWKAIPQLKGSFQVLVGDHLEAMSNGLYKSVVHRGIPSTDKTRLSIASFHSLGIDEIVEPAMKLSDHNHQKAYKGSSFKDYLMHLSSRQTKSFIETLKI